MFCLLYLNIVLISLFVCLYVSWLVYLLFYSSDSKKFDPFLLIYMIAFATMLYR